MKESKKLIRLALILIVGGIAYWQKGRFPDLNSASSGSSTTPSANVSQESVSNQKVGRYDKLEGCVLVDAKNNDGDSFMVRHGDREFELRLYFVDAPEKYLSDRHESQRRRVAEQAREMGGVEVGEIVQIGVEAKEFTKKQLAGKTFTVYTYWEQVYDGDRYYGFVELPDSGEFLGNELVKNGLVRVHTKGPGSKSDPVPTPKGDAFFKHRDKLYSMEKAAQRSKAGAWGL